MAKLTAYNLGVVFFAATGGFTYGFGFGVFVSSVGYPGFYEYFGLDRTSEKTASILGAVNALFALGAAVGAITQSYTSDRLGRRKAIFFSAALCTVGGAIVAGSVAIPMMIVFRFFQGLGLGQSLTLSPLYITEVAPPHRRGLLIGIFSTALGAGYTVVAWISFGTYYATNQTVQWRVPLAMACVGPLFQAIGCWWVPESPRWLVWHGHEEEAWRTVRRLHHDSSDPDEAVAHAEYTQIVQQVEFDKKFEVSYLEMFRKPSWRKRTLLVIFLLFASQSTGVLGIGNYKVLIFTSLGIKGGLPIMTNAIYTMIGTSMSMVGAWLMDRYGRRIMLLIGFPINGAFLLAEALLQRRYMGTDEQGGLIACIIFLFLYIMAYNAFIDPITQAVTAEIWPTMIRAKGIALAWFAYFVGAITYTTPSQVAFRNIGWRMYMIWFCCNIVSTVLVYFFMPETKGKTLEEMGELFGDEVVMHLGEDGQIVEQKVGGKDEESVHVESRELERTGSAEDTRAAAIETTWKDV